MLKCTTLHYLKNPTEKHGTVTIDNTVTPFTIEKTVPRLIIENNVKRVKIHNIVARVTFDNTLTRNNGQQSGACYRRQNSETPGSVRYTEFPHVIEVSVAVTLAEDKEISNELHVRTPECPCDICGRLTATETPRACIGWEETIPVFQKTQ